MIETRAALEAVDTDPVSGARSLRVALVTSSYNYIRDGVALTLNRLVAYLESNGVEVLIFAPVSKAPAFVHHGEIEPTPSAPIPFRPEYRLAFGFSSKARRRLMAFAPDIIHVATPDLLGREALRVGARLNVPVVASYHTRYETYLSHYRMGFLSKFGGTWLADFYRRCREVYVPSLSMAEVLIDQGAGDNLHLWPRGVDTRRFHPERRSQAWRTAHGIGAEEVVVAFVSRLVKEKRLATLVDVLHRLRAAGIPHRALIVGDGPERAALEGALPAAVFTGFAVEDELAQAYASADIFVFPSDTETFGSVTLEAMASGLPTLCADATGSRSLVKPGVTGFLHDAGDGEAFFRSVSILIADPARRRAMGEAARAHSLRFSWDEAMAGLLARYRALAECAVPVVDAP